MSYSTIIIAIALATPLLCVAQPVITLHLPDVSITANRLVKGDADTYGLGDWHCTFHLDLDGQRVLLKGYIVFSEKANDSTVIVGQVKHDLALPSLEGYELCVKALDLSSGSVGGPNIGARGARWYAGQGLIRRAYVVTDTFGNDVGRIGGLVQFRPVKVYLSCLYAGLYFTQ